MIGELFNELIISATAMTGDITSTVKEINGDCVFCVQATWTGTSPVGVLILQASLDNVTYTDVTPQNVSGNSGSIMFNIECPGYKYFRIFYDFTSGTGTLDVRARALALNN